MPSNKDLASKYQAVFNSPIGREVLNDLLTFCHLLEPTKNLRTEDVLFKEGRRSVGIRILKILNTKPVDLDKIIKESLNG